MQLTQCPYDGSDICVETLSGGSVLLSCDWCGAAWEWHGAWIHRVTAPDKEAVRSVRPNAPLPNN